jgi:hypothetical protein
MKQAETFTRALILSVTVFLIHAITSALYASVFGTISSVSSKIAAVSAVIVTAIGSGLAYKFVAGFLEGKLSRREIFMRWLLKGGYLKGTWVSKLRVRNGLGSSIWTVLA